MAPGLKRLVRMRQMALSQRNKARNVALKSKTKKETAVAKASVVSSGEVCPWILVTGSVGTGKTTTASRVAAALASKGWKHLEVSRLVRERKLYKEWDDELDASVFDQKLLSAELSKELRSGPAVVDFHCASCFKKALGKPLAVVLLRAETAPIWDRLEGRGYEKRKIQQNVECEIFGTVAEEVHECWAGKVPIVEVQSSTNEELESNIKQITELILEKSSAA
mmetsp:Transcript_16718/g.36342  ORF Transcript_16718/g.36342 Transcript_16718/m.36342 type:complete len:223 (-) Transcript_16718:151-819(-)